MGRYVGKIFFDAHESGVLEIKFENSQHHEPVLMQGLIERSKIFFKKNNCWQLVGEPPSGIFHLMIQYMRQQPIEHELAHQKVFALDILDRQLRFSLGEERDSAIIRILPQN